MSHTRNAVNYVLRFTVLMLLAAALVGLMIPLAARTDVTCTAGAPNHTLARLYCISDNGLVWIARGIVAFIAAVVGLEAVRKMTGAETYNDVFAQFARRDGNNSPLFIWGAYILIVNAQVSDIALVTLPGYLVAVGFQWGLLNLLSLLLVWIFARGVCRIKTDDAFTSLVNDSGTEMAAALIIIGLAVAQQIV